MTQETQENERLTRHAIIEKFYSYGCTPDKFLIGGEYERAIVHPNGRPVSYSQEFGIKWFLEQFKQRWNWKPKYEKENIIALEKNGASITLEPGGQFELSGAAHRDLSALEQEFVENRNCLRELCATANLHTITCGLTPIASIESVDWMPKGRYVVMREYLPTHGDLAHYMMKGTTSIQCNYDFQNEEDCARKVRLCAGIAPITTAIFANSPLYQNKFTNMQSFRGHIWTRTDPARTGFPPGLRDDFSYERWVDYLLQVPMMFIQRGDNWIHAHGKTFTEFMTTGIQGEFANWDDWELHMTSTFPEVRIKKTIEVRGADCVSHDLAIGFCSLFTGVLYDPQALDQGLALVEEITSLGSREERFTTACTQGLQGKFQQTSIHALAMRFMDIAHSGLSRYQNHNTHLLDALSTQIQTGYSPSHALLDLWKKDASPTSIIQYLTY